jgi:hypothetical protein
MGAFRIFELNRSLNERLRDRLEQNAGCRTNHPNERRTS